jgi:hypothetical protein
MGVEYCKDSIIDIPPTNSPTTITTCGLTTEIQATIGFAGSTPFINAMEPYNYYTNDCGGNKTKINPYVSGILGNWYPRTSYKYLTERTKNDKQTTATNLRRDGLYEDFDRFWIFVDGEWKKETSLLNSKNWKWTNTITIKDNNGNEVENKNPLGIYSAALYGYNDNLPMAVANNTTHKEIVYENFEEIKDNIECGVTIPPIIPAINCNKHFPIIGYSISATKAHTGKNSMKLPYGIFSSFPIQIGNSDVEMISNKVMNDKFLTSSTNPTPPHELDISMIPEQIQSRFSPEKSKKYIVSYWISTNNQGYEKMTNPLVAMGSSNPGVTFNRLSIGEPIEGWQKVVWQMEVLSTASTDFMMTFNNLQNADIYLDDFRITPLKSSMKGYVYEDITKRFIAELDENNFATFYEYDEDGTLVRVKKETEKGIFTIKEIRKSLKK